MSADQTQNSMPPEGPRDPLAQKKESAPVVERPPDGPSEQSKQQEHAQQEFAPEQIASREEQKIPETSLPVDSENFLDEAIGSLKEKLRSKKKHVKPLPQIKDQVTVQIEHIMEEGLKDAYLELTPVEQQEFKIKGEETALQIRELLKRGRVKIKQIFKLLIEWLIMLPGVNKFFAEQEAKIKADKILELKQK